MLHQPAPEPCESVTPFMIPRHIKTRTTKANPKISEKEWAVSFTGKKKDQASSLSDRELLDDWWLDAQRFPLAFINGNHAPKIPYSKFIYVEHVDKETINDQAPTWTKYDYEHTPSKAFKALPIDAIVHLPFPQWTCLAQPNVIKMPPHWNACGT